MFAIVFRKSDKTRDIDVSITIWNKAKQAPSIQKESIRVAEFGI